MENKFERVEKENDPNRCQASVGNIQCPYKAQQYKKFCPMHTSGIESGAKQNLSLYRLGKYQLRVDEIKDHNEIKSLRSEIGIARMLLEEIIKSCQNETDLIIHHNKIANLVIQIEKLVSSCQKLEIQTSGLLDKTSALNLANTIVSILTRHITDSELISAIADDILITITEQKKSAT